MNQSIKSILILTAFVLLLSFAVYLTDKHQSTVTAAKHCQLTESLSCRFNLVELNNQQVIVNFSAKVQVEEQNAVQLILPTQLRLKQIWIQGVNMYMGKIAVVEQTQSSQKVLNNHQLMFFIGSCSEPNMQWQLIIELEDQINRKTERFFVNFSTVLE